jgi:hypothetical protein
MIETLPRKRLRTEKKNPTPVEPNENGRLRASKEGKQIKREDLPCVCLDTTRYAAVKLLSRHK